MRKKILVLLVVSSIILMMQQPVAAVSFGAKKYNPAPSIYTTLTAGSNGVFSIRGSTPSLFSGPDDAEIAIYKTIYARDSGTIKIGIDWSILGHLSAGPPFCQCGWIVWYFCCPIGNELSFNKYTEAKNPPQPCYADCNGGLWTWEGFQTWAHHDTSEKVAMPNPVSRGQSYSIGFYVEFYMDGWAEIQDAWQYGDPLVGQVFDITYTIGF